ncbi:alpha/beta fold hydrolase [Sandarakinorhabdus sp.]|jgi:homoserine O-acetyltransferase|uniref:alpha/beta fold hydrolase n=1 Tax=Sandarakinorhabdus sp. TaxID=1916663 RepID=UPI0028AFB4E9|nr:alpha/beta fold hydrolase [Sandarakinorhabdus sp.]
MMLRMMAVAALLATTATAAPTVTEADFVARDFRFSDGKTLPQLKQHYRTLGTPIRNAKGEIINAVMVGHGTGGTGAQFLVPQFARLFEPGGTLDAAKYFIILPDAIGHGGSSKPSDGLKMAFPAYDYGDMVRAQGQLLDHLGVKQLRLLAGTSMGCMMGFQFGIDLPDRAAAIMPLACNVIEIAGRNRQWRSMAIQAIKADPAWNGGNYTAPPEQGLKLGMALQAMASSAPVRQQADWPTRAAADAAATAVLSRPGASMGDANDRIYQLDASRNYNPAPNLARITVPVTWVNSADDFINPPGVGEPERHVRAMPQARYVLIPETTETRGHSTHTWSIFWEGELKALLARSQ